jgi:hypothetical protein
MIIILEKYSRNTREILENLIMVDENSREFLEKVPRLNFIN